MATKNNLGSDSHRSVVARQQDIMNQLIQAAKILYETLDIKRSMTVATGFNGTKAGPIIRLPEVHTSIADPIVVERLRQKLLESQCNSVSFIYPVRLDDLRIDGGKSESPTMLGLLLEVQSVGASSLIRFMSLNERVGGKNIFAPPTPITGKVFGVVYPDVLNE